MGPGTATAHREPRRRCRGGSSAGAGIDDLCAWVCLPAPPRESAPLTRHGLRVSVEVDHVDDATAVEPHEAGVLLLNRLVIDGARGVVAGDHLIPVESVHG